MRPPPMMMVAPPMMPPPPPPESDKHIRALTSMPYDGFMSWLGKGAASDRILPSIELFVLRAPEVSDWQCSKSS